jgi:phage terminase large subunit-like protein
VSTSGNVLTVEASDVSSSWGKRPDWVVCDELVEWRRPELWQAIWSATGKRPRSRVIVITTSGWDKSHFAWNARNQALLVGRIGGRHDRNRERIAYK